MVMRLADNLFYAAGATGPGIFLDLRSGRYFSLCEPQDETARALICRGEAGRVPSCATVLVDRGILVEAETARSDRLLRKPVAGPSVSGTLASAPVAGALLANVQAASARRRYDLSHLRTWFWRQRCASACSDPGEVIAAVTRAFGVVDAFWSRRDRCLERSLAFAITCRRRGVPARVVFGVHADPFGAHSWVQLENRVLSDEPEYVRRFEPIMAW